MNAPSQTLTCPKCAGQMRSYERNGVTVDQCTECRGIFLDRGELERLIDAEGAHYEREFAERRDERRDDDRRGERRDYDDRRGDERRREKPKKSKKRSFLENIMENLGE